MGRGWGQVAKPTYPPASEVGGFLGPTWPPLLFPCFVDFQGHPAWPVPPGVGTGGGGRVGVGITRGLHSPPSSSTNVDEVVSQGSWEAHFLFRPQDFPRQAPPGQEEAHMTVGPLRGTAQAPVHIVSYPHHHNGEQRLQSHERSGHSLPPNSEPLALTPTWQVGGSWACRMVV